MVDIKRNSGEHARTLWGPRQERSSRKRMRLKYAWWRAEQAWFFAAYARCGDDMPSTRASYYRKTGLS